MSDVHTGQENVSKVELEPCTECGELAYLINGLCPEDYSHADSMRSKGTPAYEALSNIPVPPLEREGPLFGYGSKRH